MTDELQWKAALQSKTTIIVEEQAQAAAAAAERAVRPPDIQAEAAFFTADYDTTPAGRFENIDRIRLRWAKADLFELIPKNNGPFAFIRDTGERIEPENLFTDGGSIPRFVTAASARLSPWGYAPAFLIHDWEFDLHHCGRLPAGKAFEDVRDTMMEALKTLMETGISPINKIDFQLIYMGINSVIARNVWNRQHPVRPIPPHRPE